MPAATSVSPAPAPGSWRAWLLASRPATLWAAVAPVAVGTGSAVGAGGFRADTALAALAVAIWIQIGTNFANDVFDFEKGADTEERLGPTRAVQAGLLTAGQMRRGMILAFGLAVAAGLYLAWVAGPMMIALGALCILSGIAYTGGPYPLGYHGLGDLFVLLFFGYVAVCGTAYVQVGTVPATAWWSAVPVGGLATAILVVNNLRDRPTDARAGKRTLVVRFGDAFGRLEYQCLVVISFAVPPLLAALGITGLWALLPLTVAPLALRLMGQVRRLEGPALNPILGGTARLLLLYSLLFAVGLALGASPSP